MSLYQEQCHVACVHCKRFFTIIITCMFKPFAVFRKYSFCLLYAYFCPNLSSFYQVVGVSLVTNKIQTLLFIFFFKRQKAESEIKLLLECAPMLSNINDCSLTK